MKVSAIAVTLLVAVAAALPTGSPDSEANAEQLFRRQGSTLARCKKACSGGPQDLASFCRSIPIVIRPSCLSVFVSVKVSQTVCRGFCDVLY